MFARCTYESSQWVRLAVDFICSFGIVSELEMHTTNCDNKVESGIKIYFKQKKQQQQRSKNTKKCMKWKYNRIHLWMYAVQCSADTCICAFWTLSDSVCMMSALLLLLLLPVLPFKHSVYISIPKLNNVHHLMLWIRLCVLLFSPLARSLARSLSLCLLFSVCRFVRFIPFQLFRPFHLSHWLDTHDSQSQCIFKF